MPHHDSPGSWDDLNSSRWGVCLNWLCDDVISMDLPQIAGHVRLRDPIVFKAGVDREPLILIGHWDVAHDEADGTVTAPDVTLGARIAFIFGADGVTMDSLPARLRVHDLLIERYAKQPRPADLQTAFNTHFPGTCILSVTCRPDAPGTQEAAAQNMGAGSLVVRFLVRYPSTA